MPTWTWVLIAYVAVAVLTIGRFAVLHPNSVCSCVGSGDPAAYMWALSWWPHALAHGLNPFVSHELWAPSGVNVAQGAMIPTAAIAMAPITALFGPVVSYNVLSVASPVLAAAGAYLLCRRIVGRELPAAVGGYLFGFSAYEFGQLQGHLNLTLIFLMPLIALLALRRAEGAVSRAVYLGAMACLLVLQAGLSSELLADAVAVGAVTLLAAYLLGDVKWRHAVAGIARETLVAGVVAIILASPFLYYALFSGAFPKGAPALPDVYGMDLLNPFFPTYATWLGSKAFLSLGLTYTQGNVTEAGGYLGIPLIIGFLIWALGDARSSALSRVLLTVCGATVLGALGAHLHIAGQQTIVLPFNWIRHLPIADNVLPVRLFMFTTLATAVGLACWLASDARGGTKRWAVVVAGLVLVLPNLLRPLYGTSPHNPKLFSSSLYRHYLRNGDTDLVLPFGANDVSMLWQAETGFYFRMPEGYVSGVIPAAFAGNITVARLVSDTPPPPAELGTFIREHAVDHVIVDPMSKGVWPSELASLGFHGRLVGGAFIYTVPSEASTKAAR